MPLLFLRSASNTGSGAGASAGTGEEDSNASNNSSNNKNNNNNNISSSNNGTSDLTPSQNGSDISPGPPTKSSKGKQTQDMSPAAPIAAHALAPGPGPGPGPEALVPPPSSTNTPSKYNPTRFLRRKPSAAVKAASQTVSSSKNNKATTGSTENVVVISATAQNQGREQGRDDRSGSEADLEQPQSASSAFFSDIGTRRGEDYHNNGGEVIHARGYSLDSGDGAEKVDEDEHATPMMGSHSRLGPSLTSLPTSPFHRASSSPTHAQTLKKRLQPRSPTTNKREAGYWQDGASNALFGISTSSRGRNSPPPPAWVHDARANISPPPPRSRSGTGSGSGPAPIPLSASASASTSASVSRRILDPAEMHVPSEHERNLYRDSGNHTGQPLTPPSHSLDFGFGSASGSGTDQPYYPTALSPPRRPMPRSPRPPGQPPAVTPSQAQLQSQSQSYTHSQTAMSTSTSFSVLAVPSRPDSDLTHLHRSSPSLDGVRRSPYLMASTSSASAGSPGTGTGLSAEWLARKPSSSANARLGRKNSLGVERVRQHASSSSRRRAVPDLSPVSASASTAGHGQNQESGTGAGAEAGAGLPGIVDTDSNPGTTDSEGASPSAGGNSQDSDIELATAGSNSAAVGKRRSITSRDGYEVEVRCNDEFWNGSEGGGEGEMKWQIVIRKKTQYPKLKPLVTDHSDPSTPGSSSSNPHPNGYTNGSINGSGTPATNNSSSQAMPLQVSTHRSLATAPPTASSINLSLSLDRPTGKLVFIAFPMDLQATPRRRPSTSTHTRPRLHTPSRSDFSTTSSLGLGSGAGGGGGAAGGLNTPSRISSPSSSPRSTRFERPFDPHNSILGPGPVHRSGAGSGPPSPVRPPTPPRPARPSTPPPTSSTSTTTTTNQSSVPATPQTPPSQSSSKMDKVEYPVTPTRKRLSGQLANTSSSLSSSTSSRPNSLIHLLSNSHSHSRSGSQNFPYSTNSTPPYQPASTTSLAHSHSHSHSHSYSYSQSQSQSHSRTHSGSSYTLSPPIALIPGSGSGAGVAHATGAASGGGSRSRSRPGSGDGIGSSSSNSSGGVRSNLMGTPMTSPPSAGVGTGSPFSPNGSNNRRTRFVNAPQLEGGLYARGTVDGLSEELEGLEVDVNQNQRIR